MTIGEYIKKLREEKNLSINQLALYSGISAAHISRIERGLREPSPEILKKLAAALKVSYKDLMKTAGYLDIENYTSSEDKQWQPELTEKDKKDIVKELEKLLNDLEHSEGLAFFNGEPLDDETKEHIKNALKLGLEIAKVKNKQKYTPKKYRK